MMSLNGHLLQPVGSDLYKSDWKLQGNTNTQLKLLCRASYTGKSGGNRYDLSTRFAFIAVLQYTAKFLYC